MILVRLKLLIWILTPTWAKKQKNKISMVYKMPESRLAIWSFPSVYHSGSSFTTIIWTHMGVMDS